MQQKVCKVFTYRARITISNKDSRELIKCAALLSKVERKFFKDHYQNNKNINELKSGYIKEFNISARHFNSCRIRVQGKVKSYLEILKENIPFLEGKIKKLKKHVKKLEQEKKQSKKKIAKNPQLNQKEKLHHKKRKLIHLERKLEKLKQDKKENKIRICFGGKKLFKKQFSLEENNMSQEKWKKKWQDKRNNSFFLVGSKDESYGNQNCQISRNGDLFNIALRLPNCSSKKYVTIKNIDFTYGKEEIIAAIEENEKRKRIKKEKGDYSHFGKAITFLFKQDEKGWTVFATIEKEPPNQISRYNIGMIGLDININHIALTETDHYGNLLNKKSIPINLYGKNKNQTLAIIGDVTKEIVKIAILKEKPIVLENLDFSKKKQDLKNQNNKYSRMLSSFSYSKIISFIENKAFRKGIKTYKINPAFTSIIGRIKFRTKYGLTVHQAAAFAIARRPCRYSEKLPSCLEINNGNSTSAFFLPARNRKKHVWSIYGELNKKLKALNELNSSTVFRSSRPFGLLCDENSVIYRGSSGTLIVNKTARLTCQNKSI